MKRIMLVCLYALAVSCNVMAKQPSPLWQEKNRPNYQNVSAKEVTVKRDIISIQNVQAATIEVFSNETRITAKTPPAFIIHSGNDKAVPVENSIRMYQALVKHKVEAAC